MVKNTHNGLSSPVAFMDWEVGQTYTAKHNCAGVFSTKSQDIGFHVLTTRVSARKLCSHWNSIYNNDHVVVKTIVSKFVGAGVFGTYKAAYQSETWKKCKIVEIAR